MRVAALYDIHGNLPALEAVLREVRAAVVDVVVVGGDVLPGPMPQECLTLLSGLQGDVRFLQGNGETDVLASIAGDDISHVPEPFHETMRWNGDQLNADCTELISGWPLDLSIQIDGIGPTYFCHATPRNNRDIFTRLTPDGVLEPMFEPVAAEVAVCGHTHMQFDRRIGSKRVVNAGSVGMPFGEPGAYWLLLGPTVELRRTAYDLQDAATRISATAYPQAADFAARNVISPPKEADMLEVFRSAEIR